MTTVRRLKRWQIVLVVVVLAVGAFAAYYLLGRPDDQGNAGLADNEQLVAVVRGELVNQVQTSGTLSFPQKEALTISPSAVVKSVFVEEGQTVVNGQALLALDDATVAEHEAEVVKAQIALRSAQKALNDLQSDAQRTLSDAQSDVEGAESQLSSTTEAQDELVKTATEKVTTVAKAYKTVFAAWLGVTLTDRQAELPPEQILAQWGLDIEMLFTADGGSVLSQGIYSADAPPDDPATPWSETLLYGILNFYPGEIVATCEDAQEHPLHGHCVQKGFDDAWKALGMAKKEMSDATQKRTDELRKAQDALDKARKDLQTAEQDIQDVTEGERGYTFSLKQAELESAKIALDSALERRGNATLRAPFAGIVAKLNAKPGETLAKDVRTAIEIIDSSAIELTGRINETEVQRVSEGDTAHITLDALPGQNLTGEVTSVSSSAEQVEGIAVFTVTIHITVPSDINLREGMNANARMAVQREEDVLLVPVQAIYGTLREPLVRVMSDGVITNRPVTLGNSDNFRVVIESGVEEGEEVVVHVAQSGPDNFGFASIE